MKTNPAIDQMKRGEFLRSLGLSSAALMSFYCLGTTMTACSKSSDPAPATTSTNSTGLTGNADSSKGPVDFTLDLTHADFKSLKTVGGYANVGDIVVANSKGNNIVAIGRICTHQGGNLEYQLADDVFRCNIHQSLYGTDGKVKPNQEATKDVKQYKTILSADGNKLQVKA
ncbi:MAG: (2Fe-2S)-binding protein [Spirosoma sp.]|nr:(2Fe-2S)-binding protein [Spirosoma sp.]